MSLSPFSLSRPKKPPIPPPTTHTYKQPPDLLRGRRPRSLQRRPPLSPGAWLREQAASPKVGVRQIQTGREQRGGRASCTRPPPPPSRAPPQFRDTVPTPENCGRSGPPRLGPPQSAAWPGAHPLGPESPSRRALHHLAAAMLGSGAARTASVEEGRKRETRSGEWLAGGGGMEGMGWDGMDGPGGSAAERQPAEPRG